MLRGAGSAPGGTQFVYRPDANTAYDALTEDGSDWDEDGMTSGQAKGGWLWPGRGLFRVQSRGVHSAYAADYAAAPANRKDIFEGTVNVHWKVGVTLRAKPGDAGFAGRTGDTTVYLASSGSLANLTVGGLVNVRAANTVKFYAQQNIAPADGTLLDQHMRQQIFTVTGIDTANRTVTLNKPLEFDVPVDLHVGRFRADRVGRLRLEGLPSRRPRARRRLREPRLHTGHARPEPDGCRAQLRQHVPGARNARHRVQVGGGLAGSAASARR